MLTYFCVIKFTVQWEKISKRTFAVARSSLVVDIIYIIGSSIFYLRLCTKHVLRLVYGLHKFGHFESPLALLDLKNWKSPFFNPLKEELITRTTSNLFLFLNMNKLKKSYMFSIKMLQKNSGHVFLAAVNEHRANVEVKCERYQTMLLESRNLFGTSKILCNRKTELKLNAFNEYENLNWLNWFHYVFGSSLID